MDKKIKAKWVNALRSGDYKQTRMQLRNAEGWCCLGVLADVCADDWLPVKGREEYAQPFLDGKQIGDICDLTTKWCEKIGLPLKEKGHLMSMNDSNENTFEEIADYIEKKL